jgi:predicted RNase H-like HicB family nuclease/DNA-binding transcriptional MerR regulator
LVEVKTYTAACQRSGKWWSISVPEIKGLHSQARRLDQVEEMARDAIALMLDIPAESFAVEVHPELPPVAARAVEARRAAKEAAKQADEETTSAVRLLLAEGFTVRDIGAMLGLSPQRISQLTHQIAKIVAAERRSVEAAIAAPATKPLEGEDVNLQALDLEEQAQLVEREKELRLEQGRLGRAS